MQSFSDLAIPAPIKNALDKLEFNKPTEIQAAAIPIALEGKDVIATAATGSGKTAAFAVPAITMLVNNPDKNALILAPTRELAQQIGEFVRKITDYCEGISMVSIVGGFDMHRQLNALKRKPRIIIGTPGRVTDHLRRRSLNLSNTGILILDEGDRMLDMGFAPQLDAILQFLPQKRQTMLFTATLPPKVKQLASQYLHKPQEVMVGKTSQPVETVAQHAISVPQELKNEFLLDELNKRTGSVIVFARTQRRTDALARYLEDYGVEVTTIHGGLTQGKRNRAIKGFKEGDFRVLVATDIAARGIDVPEVEHVINFDLPLMDEDYVHRVGRTARNGAKGEALSFVSDHEYGLWAAISRKYNVHSDDVVDPRKNKGKKKGKVKMKDGAPKERQFTSGKNKDNSFYVTDELTTEIPVMKDAGDAEVVPEEGTRKERRAKKFQKGFQRDSEAFDPEDRVASKALAEENLSLDMQDGVKIELDAEEGFIPADRYEKRKKFGKDRGEKRERFGKGSRFNGDAFEKPRGSKPFIDSFFMEDDNQNDGGFEEREERRPRRFNNDGPRGGRFGGGKSFGDRKPFGGGGKRFGGKSGGFSGRKFDRGGDRFDRGERSFNRDDRGERSFGRDDRGERGFERGGFGGKKKFGGRGGDDRFEKRGGKSFGGKSFGDRKPFGGGKSFGDRKPFGGGKSFGDRKPFGARRRDDEGFGGGEGGEGRPKRKNFYSKDKERRSNFNKRNDARY